MRSTLTILGQIYQLEEYAENLGSEEGVPTYPTLPTHYVDPTVKVEQTHGQEHNMTQTLNSEYPSTSPITLRTFQETMGPGRPDRSRNITHLQNSNPSYVYTKKVNPANPNAGRPEHLNQGSQVLLNDTKFKRRNVHHIHTLQKPELMTHNTKYNHSRKAYDLGQKAADEDYYHTARRTPYQATKQGKDDLA